MNTRLNWRRFAARRTAAVAVVVLSGGYLAQSSVGSAAEVNVYSYREPALIDPLLKKFETDTGILVNVVFAKDGLIERATAEGANSPADVMLTNESGLLVQARDAGIAAKLASPVLEAAIPAGLRDPDGQWFGLTRRARVVYASKERVAIDSLRYEDLADPKWRGKICMRSGQHTYNIALIASIIAHDGAEAAEKWLTGVRDNLARPPAGSDRDQVKGIYAGDCDIALGNTYYMGQMLNNDKQPEQKVWASAVKLIFPNANDRGTHVNISGGLLMAHAPNRDAGIKLLEFLASKEAQGLYAELNSEYPVRADVAPSAMVQGWGVLKPDALPLAEVAKLRKAASELVDRIGFDDGPRG